ncbi:hypothetical protein SEVIR_4G299900v4 [Setaria viridis]|uniref:DUF4378 domain-containing protein n=1 Tax=Setaria viridis TaxID=4556 RepID=A0A4U6V5T6_SETVI|nr:uncharacterized protein LOC117853233 [Setaria viridis]XP_034591503.1 uncharacterized protein LOC117853233 [Setaria viridis]XP_034591504.1 uncharacterized protein LOC117853233 [Setaria viridis]XP_034591505.1 uncharacterized protein LOC117853233 [Setaria viridis]XP_034591506.1 uncharacterized protein LOC117853233 [Setaria viridis]TKW23565.1 hypothetical protein SEVIR_4G299900v2 [Setaria viridis]
MQMSHHHTKPSRRRSRGTAEKAASREIPIQPPPNVIARLMGIDAIPIPIPAPKPAAIVQAHAHPTSCLKPPATASGAEAKVISPRSAPFRQAKCSLLSYRSRDLNGDSSSSRHHCLKKMRVPGRSRSRQRRRHPQEDLLQKIRHDFQAAWQQASNAMDSCSVTSAARLPTTSSTHLLDGRCIQMIAQENLRKQKMARYGLASSMAMEGENSLKNAMQQTDDPKPEERVITVLRAGPCAGAAASGKFRDLEGADKDEELLQPTTIVLLKPSSDVDAQEGQEPLFGLPKVTRDGNMSRFLQEVKEMLQQQLKANATSDLNTTTWGTEPEQIARGLAKQTKETVTKDLLSKRFFRSESFRGFRSDRKRKEATTKQASPEHVRIVTRNHLAHRITSATPRARTETVSSSPKKDDEESVSSSCSITSSERVRSLADVSPSASGIGFGDECQMKHKDDSTVSSARALFRSFSAPELGFSLGILFGDGSVRSATHEASGMASEGSAAMTSKNRTSFGFIRGTVSSLRHSFSLRKNLFRRKTHWSKKTSLVELHPQMAIGTAPPSPETFNLFKVAQANLTELPPSPVSPLEGHSCRHFFSDLNCTLPELSPKCVSEFEAPASELSYRTDITGETACNQDKAYIREVLVAAGLYDDGSSDNKANARVDSMARPICDGIFEEVEDIYYYRGKYCDDAIGTYNDAGGNATDHRMLFDLANEALQSLVQGAKTGSSLRQWIIDSTGVSRGRRLVDDVWQQVQTLRNPQMQEMQTIDSMVAYEIRKSVWADALYEDVYVVGRKIERAIFDELVEDLMVEVFI